MFDELFPLKETPSAADRLFGFDTVGNASRGFTVQSILDLIAADPVTWASITGMPATFAPAGHTLGSHSNVAAGVDAAADGTFVKKVAGVFTAVAVDFYGVTNPPPADATIDNALRAITAARIAQWDAAYGWGNHAGQYRSVAWVPAWGDVTGKPTTFAPSGHTLGSHTDAAALAAATEGQLVRKAAVGFEPFTAPYYSPTNPPPIDASVPDFVRDFTIGQFAGYEMKMLEWAGLPDGTVPLIKDGIPADSELKGVYSVNPYDPETQPVEYDAFVSELQYLISSKRIKGVAGVDGEDYVVKSQLEGLGGGGSTAYLTDLDTWPVLKFDKNYRYVHDMAGAVALSVEAVTPLTVVGNVCKLYIKANGTNKPTLSADFTVVWDNWSNTAGHWNRYLVEWTPEGKAIVQVEQIHLGTANDGTGVTELTISFEANLVVTHIITNSTKILLNTVGALVGYNTTLYVKADGINKPFWGSDIIVTYDNYLNTANIWNRIKLEWRPENKAIAQLINT